MILGAEITIEKPLLGEPQRLDQSISISIVSRQSARFALHSSPMFFSFHHYDIDKRSASDEGTWLPDTTLFSLFIPFRRRSKVSDRHACVCVCLCEKSAEIKMISCAVWRNHYGGYERDNGLPHNCIAEPRTCTSDRHHTRRSTQ